MPCGIRGDMSGNANHMFVSTFRGPHCLLSHEAMVHYRVLEASVALHYVAAENTGCGLFATYAVARGRHLAEYRGESMTPREAESRSKSRGERNGTYEYFMTVHGGEFFIDATSSHCDARYTNHGCSANSRFVTIRFRDDLYYSAYDVVFVEATKRIHAKYEVVVPYGWDRTRNENLVVFECRARHCKGYI